MPVRIQLDIACGAEISERANENSSYLFLTCRLNDVLLPFGYLEVIVTPP